MMKKLALLLALALALSCCLLMLASCSEDGGDTSSTAATSSNGTSSSAASSAAASSEKEASSEAPAESSEPEEESSEPEESSEIEWNPDANENPDGKNLAAGATYVRSDLYRASEGEDPIYPDPDNEKLTDGILPEEDGPYTDPAWVGFHGRTADYAELGYAYITVDLEDVFQISEVTLYVGTSFLSGGITPPTSVEFFVSEDGENFVSIGSATYADDTTVSYTAATLECEVTGQYVQARIVRNDAWIFVCEFEVR